MGQISELKFDDKNFNKHTQRGMGLLEKSLNDYGAGRSILVDKDNNIIAGNGIVEAAQNAGITKTKIVETDGTELVVVRRKDVALNSEQGRGMALADNATAAADLEWDKDTLGEFFDDEYLKQWDVKVDWAEKEDVEEDDAPEVDEKGNADSELGKVYKLGEHRLMCGDSTDPANVETLMDGKQADLWLTDPPYNVDYEGGTGLKIQNDKMGDESFRQFLVDAFNAATLFMKGGAAFYIWHADSEGFNFRFACKEAGLTVRECLIWNKNSLVLGRQDYQWKHEPCLYGWKDGTHGWYNDRKQTTVIDFDRPTRSGEHPTMKPVGLMGYLIQNSSKKDDIVLDTFGGSGTTLIACEQLDRKCFMMELDPKYCDVIRKRYWILKTGSEEGWQEGTK